MASVESRSTGVNTQRKTYFAAPTLILGKLSGKSEYKKYESKPTKRILKKSMFLKQSEI